MVCLPDFNLRFGRMLSSSTESATLEIWHGAQSRGVSVPGYQDRLVLPDTADAVGIEQVVLMVASGFMFVSRFLMLDHAARKPLEKSGGLGV